MELEILTDKNKYINDEWSDFVNNHPQGTIYQSPEMYNLFCASKNFHPICMQAVENNKIIGILLAAVIKEYSTKIGFFTSRVIIYGGPLIDSNHKEKNLILDLLLKKLISKVKNKSIFIQFRNFFEWGKQKKIFEENNFKYLERLNYLVNTSSDEIVRKKISKSKIRQINKALSNGTEIIDPQNENQIKEFYDILLDLYKCKVKKPLPDYSFFQNFYLQSKQNKLGIIKLIKYNNKIIGGILSPVFNNTTIYEWYVCGLDKKYKHCYPSVLATWAVIDYAVKNNIKNLDFMGVGIPGKEYGVREFKAKFGGEMVNYGRFARINNHFFYSITEIGYNILALLKRI